MRSLILTFLVFATGCKTASVDESITYAQKADFLRSKGFEVVSRKGNRFAVLKNGISTHVEVTNDLFIVFTDNLYGK